MKHFLERVITRSLGYDSLITSTGRNKEGKQYKVIVFTTKEVEEDTMNRLVKGGFIDIMDKPHIIEKRNNETAN